MKINKKHKHELKRKARWAACKRGDVRCFSSKLKLEINPSILNAVDRAVTETTDTLEKMRAKLGIK